MGPEEFSSTVCRLCDKTSDKMYYLFDHNENGTMLVDVAKGCLPVIIYESDPLSKYICEFCHDTLDVIDDFRRTVMEGMEKQKEDLQQRVSEDPEIKTYLDLIDGVKKNGECEAKLSLRNISTLTDMALTFDEMDYNNSDLNSVNSGTVNHLNGDTATESDLEVCDPNEVQNKIVERRRRQLNGIIAKKKRVVGPKSRTESNPCYRDTIEIVYNPHSLMQCVVNVLNKQNLDDYECEPYVRSEVEAREIINLCTYCGTIFETGFELAEHEANVHIRLTIDRVDAMEYWPADEQNAMLRNKWLKNMYEDYSEEISTEDGDDVEENENLLMPMDDDDNDINVVRTNDIIFVNELPTLNGVVLKDIPRDERGDFYQSVTLNGVKRKFCNLCRYTFKDNWAVELHYMSRTCYYTCNYCGVKFNKNKPTFKEHVKGHVAAGHKKSDRVFVNKSKSSAVPKELSPSCLKSYTPLYRNRMPRTYYSYEPVQPVVHEIKPPIKIEAGQENGEHYTTEDLAKSGENQAYFCKKCYQVFCKLDEFNKHNAECTGEIDDPEMQVIRPYHKKEQKISLPVQSKPNSTATVSSTGRPVRHCVKEISSYSDDREPEYNQSVSSTGHYECNYCSSVFPTFHSRNSHMRIHKMGFKPAGATPILLKRPKSQMDNYGPVPKRIKQEQPDTFEPIVEIYEGPSSKVPSNIGSVSITPVRKNKVSPAIMQLVQNNPNITLKKAESKQPVASAPPRQNPMQQQQQQQQQQQHHQNQYIQQQQLQHRQQQQHIFNAQQQQNVMTMFDNSPSDKNYKCSSCSTPFANKSNLYFHKKNHCEGSKYPCPFCKKRFGTEASYSSHIFYSHPDY